MKVFGNYALCALIVFIMFYGWGSAYLVYELREAGWRPYISAEHETGFRLDKPPVELLAISAQ